MEIELKPIKELPKSKNEFRYFVPVDEIPDPIKSKLLSKEIQGIFLASKNRQVMKIPISKCRPHPRLRPVSQSHVRNLERRIAMYGYDERFPITVAIDSDLKLYLNENSDYYFEILDGAHRWTAYKELGSRIIPAEVFTDLTDLEKCSIILESNSQKEFDPLDYGRVYDYLVQIGYAPKTIALMLDTPLRSVTECLASYYFHCKVSSMSKEAKRLFKAKQLYHLYDGNKRVPKDELDNFIDEVVKLGVSFKEYDTYILVRIFREFKNTKKPLTEILNSLTLIQPTQVVLKENKFPKIFKVLKRYCIKSQISLHDLCSEIFLIGFDVWRTRRTSEVKVKCPVCGEAGKLQIRWGKPRMKHYEGRRNKKLIYTYCKLSESDLFLLRKEYPDLILWDLWEDKVG